MRLIVPAIIIGLVGGILDYYTSLHKVWCFLIGVVAFFLFLFIKSLFTTARIMRETKGKKKIWIDQNNRMIKMVIVLTASLLPLASCVNNEKDDLGQYVYEDCNHTIHVSRECNSLPFDGVRFIDTCEFTGKYKLGSLAPTEEYEFCRKCVDDEAFRRLSSIMKRNSNEM